MRGLNMFASSSLNNFTRFVDKVACISPCLLWLVKPSILIYIYNLYCKTSVYINHKISFTLLEFPIWEIAR